MKFLKQSGRKISKKIFFELNGIAAMKLLLRRTLVQELFMA